MFFIIFCVSIITYSLIHFVPGNPAEIIAEKKYGEDVTQSAIARIESELGLDQPLIIQYAYWLSGVLRGDFGYSFRTGSPVMGEITGRFKATAELALAAMLVSLVIAVPAGILSAVKKYSWLDSITMLGALLGVSMPNFWLALLLILFFSLQLGLFPVFGSGEIKHLVLPALTLGTGMTAITTRLIRSNILETLPRDYVKCARSKGLSEGIILFRHVLKNALIPVVTVIGLQFGSLLEGAVIVEVIFARPGIGRLLYDSIFARDIPVIQGCVFFFALIYTSINLLVDISYTWLDPKIRYEDN